MSQDLTNPYSSVTIGDMGIKWTKVAAGDYETQREGRLLRLYRLPDVNPPAWNVEDVTDPYNELILVDGAASKTTATGILQSQ